MTSIYSSSIISALFASSGSSGSSIASLLDSSITSDSSNTLASDGAALTNLLLANSSASVPPPRPKPTKYAPTAPFSPQSTAPQESALVTAALSGKKFINEDGVKIDLRGASKDYSKLFAVYQGLSSLHGLATKYADKNTTSTDKASAQAAFNRGLKEVNSYVDNLNLEKFRLSRGTDTSLSLKASDVAKNAPTTYATKTLFTGKSTDTPDIFQGSVAFKIHIDRPNNNQDIDINFADLGTTPRTLSNVVSYINGKLAAAGYNTKFQVVRTPAPPNTVVAGGKTVTLPSVADNSAFSLQINYDSAEKLTFSDPSATPAIYVTTRAGNPDPDKNAKTNDGVFENTLAKFDPLGGAGTADAKLFSKTLDKSVDKVRASQVAADGSVYVLADVAGTVNGETIKGQKDVALIKYDSAGKILFQRTLGAADSASGLALGLAADGRVAVAGSITGTIKGVTNGATNSDPTSGLTDSFVTVYDSAGKEQFTQRQGTTKADEATAVAFGDNGVVYVAGRTQSAVSGGTQQGGYDSYLKAIAPDSSGTPKTLFSQQFGTAGEDRPSSIVVNGSQVIVGGIENYHGVLRSFNVGATTATTTTGAVYTSAATATVGATRDLGDLQGGTLAGLALDGGQLYVAGDTRNAALSVNGLKAAATGGKDAFAARISTNLTSQANDSLTYFGGTGDDSVAAAAVVGGKVYITGKAGAGLPGAPTLGTQSGFVAVLDPATGTVANVRSLTGKDNVAEGVSIAVGATGASDLDRLGLPSGKLDYGQANTLVAISSARAGDQFQIRTKEGGPLSTITLKADDTYQTLAARISSAAGYKAKVEVVSSGTGKTLKISPANGNSTVELLPGPAGANLLEGLGLPSGVARQTELVKGQIVTSDGGGTIYGLGLPNDLSFTNETDAKAVATTINDAMSKVQRAYRELLRAATPATTTSTAANAANAPAYLQNQVKNYQAALARLRGY